MELGVTCVGFLNDVEVAVDKERGKGNLKKSLKKSTLVMFFWCSVLRSNL